MSVIADISPVVADDRLARRNALVLSVAQALAGGNNTVIAATAGIVGTMLASDKGLATLPVSMMVIGIWFGTLPIGYLARNYGRRFALQTGSVVGTLAGLVSCAAVLMGSFELFLLGTFGCGFYAAAHNSYRFAVCDTASDAYKPKAISLVLAGGVMAGFIGSEHRDRHQGHVGAVPVRRDIRRAVGAGGARRSRADAAEIAAADAARRSARPGRPLSVIAQRSAVRRRGRLRRRQLRGDEPADDVSADRHGGLRPLGDGSRRSASSGTCSACMRRAS